MIPGVLAQPMAAPIIVNTSVTLPGFTALDPAYTESYTITLFDGNTRAIGTDGFQRSSFGATPQSTGKYYFEVRDLESIPAGSPMAGIGRDRTETGYWVGHTTDSYGHCCDGTKVTNAVFTSYGSSWLTTGDVLMVAVDFDAGKIWFGKNGTWMASGNPVTGANPAFSSIPSSAWYPMISLGGGGSIQVVCNFGSSAFAYTPPTGFGGWPSVTVGYNYWNPADTASDITLSNNNLMAYTSVAPARLARGVCGKSSGKWYWETTMQVLRSSEFSGAGICKLATSNSSNYIGQAAADYGLWVPENRIWTNGSAVTDYSDHATSDYTLKHALDLDNGKYWIGIAGGAWFSGNPATGTSPTVTGLSGTYYPACSPYLQTILANFGGSTFVDSIPSGFARWPSGP